MMARILVRPPPDPLAWPGSRLILATNPTLGRGPVPWAMISSVAKISRDPGQNSGYHFSLYT